MRRHLLAAVLAAVIPAAPALGGCGGSDGRTVDTASIERGISEQLATGDAKVSSVSCPSDVDASTGTQFTCSVAWSNGAKGKVKVVEASGGQYTYTTVPGSVKVPGSVVEQQLSKELVAEGAANAAVSCPDTIVVEVGTTATCDLSGAGGKAGGSVSFSFSGDEGKVDPASVKPT
jgi:hypothetical protein